MLQGTKKEDYQHIAVELDIDISDTKLSIFDLTNLIKDNDKYKSDLKIVKDITNNIIEDKDMMR